LLSTFAYIDAALGVSNTEEEEFRKKAVLDL
jgi:hypothetical protein